MEGCRKNGDCDIYAWFPHERPFCWIRTGRRSGNCDRGLPCSQPRPGCGGSGAARVFGILATEEESMKLSLAILFTMLLLPSLSRAEDVRVRLRTAHPPASMTIRSTEGTLRWRRCLSCEEQSGSSLTIVAPANSTMTEGNSDSEFFVTGRYELNSNGAPSFYSQFPLDVRAKSGILLIVVTMPLQDYVQHVLMAESGDFRNQESIKAMAIATRTYATRFANQHKNEGFDFCDTTHCQVFHWKEANERIRNAVEATEGQTVAYHG